MWEGEAARDTVTMENNVVEHNKMCLTRCGKQTAVMSVINLQQYNSVDHTWRSHRWQHPKVIVVRENAADFQN